MNAHALIRPLLSSIYNNHYIFQYNAHSAHITLFVDLTETRTALEMKFGLLRKWAVPKHIFALEQFPIIFIIDKYVYSYIPLLSFTMWIGASESMCIEYIYADSLASCFYFNETSIYLSLIYYLPRRSLSDSRYNRTHIQFIPLFQLSGSTVIGNIIRLHDLICINIKWLTNNTIIDLNIMYECVHLKWTHSQREHLMICNVLFYRELYYESCM